MAAAPPPPPQWVVDLNSTPASKPKNPALIDPPGYTASLTKKERSQASKNQRVPPTADEMDTLKMKKAWEVAIAPAKQLPMNAFGMYMTGNTLQIFSVFMVFTLFKTPVLAVLGLQRTFAPYQTPGTAGRLLGVKLVYIACNLLMLALGIWKVNAMGLLPTTRSDWLAWESERTWSERAVPQEWL
ncbi:hypothetical protein COCMIDRAFT_107434 [Bipolaris oryzae ATCC 44560]|uniref:ER membrane protein complex subunit 4 n=3 Tax=Bipolaris TaxID=33194 RepID=W6XUC4_COCC2|nr:uncharacterized protein COCMIDRAFT_107434 [Bipolaris oryzae ATCC 44560]XP_007716363.1 uncharacterized protein COCCADRAFT_8446 [Bipolaris zeicola 26-R-13]XP_014552166.1 hypothetical protein COCVIDRAFT_111010 [Bipolaris victoriae FI3]EUC29323.1 hypothetical protein COCCADRAFT_8446 [Bipolaris zeicola 26-R-13]EUC40967.1 hypothetical protein COCMIDRAFT_107434 [Bipolaris oryzae ATCC 44560]